MCGAALAVVRSGSKHGACCVARARWGNAGGGGGAAEYRRRLGSLGFLSFAGPLLPIVSLHLFPV